jgi:capsular exopolysaccharide synthesis family protein
MSRIHDALRRAERETSNLPVAFSRRRELTPQQLAPAGVGPYYDTVEVEPEVHLRDYLMVLKRRRWWLLGVFAAVVGFAMWKLDRATPIYQADATIRIDEPDEDIPIISEIASLSKGSPLMTEIEILKSRSLAEKVVRDLGLNVGVVQPKVNRSAVIDTAWVTAQWPPTGSYLLKYEDGVWTASRMLGNDSMVQRPDLIVARATQGQPLALPGVKIVPRSPENSGTASFVVWVGRVRDAVGGMLGRLSVTAPVKQANVVFVTYRHPDPILAKEAVDAVASKFIEHSSQTNKTEARSTREFIQTQLTQLSKELKEREEELQAYKESAQIVELSSEAQQRISQYARFEAEQSQYQIERTALVSLMNELDKTDARGSDVSTFPSFIQNEAIQQLKVQQNVLEAERNKLLTELTPSHPDVVAVQQQVEHIQQNLRVAAEGYRTALDSRINALGQTLGRFQADLDRLPEKEVDLARLTRAKQVKEQLYVQLQGKLQEAEIAEAVEVASIQVVDRAIVPERPVTPKKRMTMTLALLLGIALGCGAAFAREYFDNTMRSKEHVERELRLPTIGEIPLLGENGRLRFLTKPVIALRGGKTQARGSRDGDSNLPARTVGQPSGRRKLITQLPPFSPAVEAYRALCTNVGFLPLDPSRGGRRTVLVSSPGPNDGKSTTATNLAICFAQQGSVTVLVDADMRKSSLHRYFGLNRRPGLSDYLSHRASLEDILHSTTVNRLSFVSAGSAVALPLELLGSEKMNQFLEAVLRVAEVVIFDSPPTLAVADAHALAPMMDDTLLVIRSGFTDKAAAADALALLSGGGANRVTCVLNGVNYLEAYGASYYRQYYQGYYTSDAVDRVEEAHWEPVPDESDERQASFGPTS